MSDTIRVLLVTCPPDEAPALVRTLVEERLVACGNIIPGVRSIYRWQGEVCDDTEALVVMETTPAREPDVRARLRELHSYSVPKIVTLSPEAVNADYAKWAAEVTGLVKDPRG